MIRFDAMGKSIRGLAAACLIAALAPGLPSPAAAQAPYGDPAQARPQADAERQKDLRRKGLDDTQIEAALDQPELDWFELALALLSRRAKATDLADFKLRMKWLKYLMGRGFTQEQARYALSAMQGEQ